MTMSLWPFEADHVLVVELGQDARMHRVGLARIAGDQFVFRGDGREDLALRGRGQLAEAEAHGLVLHAVEFGELVLVLAQERRRVGEHAVVERGLDVEHLHVLVDDGALTLDLGAEHGARRIHHAVAAEQGVGLVVHAHAFVVAQPHCHDLCPPSMAPG